MPILTQLITYFASRKASRLSNVFVIRMDSPFSSMSLWHSSPTISRFLGLMSVKAISISWNSGTDSRSAKSPRVKPMEPAPMKATLKPILSSCWVRFL